MGSGTTDNNGDGHCVKVSGNKFKLFCLLKSFCHDRTAVDFSLYFWIPFFFLVNRIAPVVESRDSDQILEHSTNLVSASEDEVRKRGKIHRDTVLKLTLRNITD